MLKNLNRWVGVIFNPRPTLLDLMIGSFLVVPFLRGDATKATFIIYYSFFLAIIGFMMKPKREYRSIPLMLLSAWALISIFLHNTIEVLPGHNLFNYHKNMDLGMEGFLFLFAGSLFVITVIRHATNLRFTYLIIPFCFIPWIRNMEYWGSMTPMLGVGLAIFIYLVLRKKRIAASLCALTGLTIIVKNWNWVCIKFTCRPMVWWQLTKDMFYGIERSGIGVNGKFILDPGIRLAPHIENFLTAHNITQIKPWLASIIGVGFPHRLLGNYTWVDNDIYGWCYNMNDFLSLGKFLGPITIVLLIWFFTISIKKIGVQLALIPFMAIIIICNFQMTMYDPARAGLFLVIGTVCLFEGYKKENKT